jgi:DNA-binding response OmpR family regulator
VKDTIWIIEDDIGCQFVYEQILKRDFNIVYFSTLAAFKNEVATPIKSSPILLIADLILPDGNFLDFLASDYRRSLAIDIPLIVVSSDDDVDTLRLCFKKGVDDYLTKPFRKNELLVKVEAILRGRSTFGGTIKPKVTIDGQIIEGLTSKESKLLMLFLEHEERQTNREVIIEKVWGGRAIHPKTIDVHLYNLRRKLSPYGQIIKSIGQGRWLLMSDQYPSESLL